MKTFVFICVVFTSVFTYSETCTCPGAHPQEHFCNEDFGRYFYIFLNLPFNLDFF